MANDLISRRLAMQLILERTPFKSKHELMQRINSSVADENGWLGGIAESLDEIEDLPAVDAVPVVRCRDCKYSYIFEPWEGKNAVRYCNQLRHAYAKDSDLPVREEGFCSYGERRKE